MMHPSADLIPILYKRYGKLWRKLRHQADFVEQNWLDSFSNFIVPKGEILDLGCGDGMPIADYLINKDYSITGVDISKPLIKFSQKQFPDQTWILGDMRSFETQKTFDAIIAWDSLFHLPPDDQCYLIKCFGQWLKKDAPVLFSTGHIEGEAIGDFNGHPLYHASLSEASYRQQLMDNGFGVLNYKIEDPHCGGRTIWLAKKR